MNIYSVAFSHDNHCAFIGLWNGFIKIIRWKAGANSGDDFNSSEEPKRVGTGSTYSICLTRDDKYLLVGSRALVSVIKAKSLRWKKKVIKEFKLTDEVRDIKLIKYGKQAIIAEKNGNLSILDLETLEISSVAENITNSKELNKIIVIEVPFSLWLAGVRYRPESIIRSRKCIRSMKIEGE